ncbi:MAG TPA: threonine--tRNA ligase [Gammaproteobacteria bacterium]|nr:threonine--tRNA ligase [Gammaproteobacteria bacterium]
MPVITLPDGSSRNFDHPVTVQQVAADIGAGLAKAALAGKVDGQLVDTSFVIEKDSTVSIITAKDADGLEVIRHSCAHLMAQAVQQLFPTAQVTIGPVIEDGFYYDFAYDRPFTPEDLVAIEQRMHEIVKQDLHVTRSLLSRDAAIKLFEQKGEKYKVEIIAGIPQAENLSFYQQGEFIDLCRGPHVPSTGSFKAFKLLKVAGAYWRGDSKNAMLQRIYGTAWADQKSLDQYLQRIEEAEKRDHRKLAKKFDLFHLQDDAPGMVFWHPNGWIIYRLIEQYIRDRITPRGYQEVRTPQVVSRALWEQSGHWDKFRQNMFTIESEDIAYSLKPMNCPCHVQIFNQGLKSYRDLPLRMAEFGSCHRNEPSGALHGIMRVRGFTQDDAHIFCTEAQIQQEVSAFIALLYEVYADFGFNEVIIRFATRPDERVGSDVIWDKAENALETALQNAKLDYTLSPKEGAFYGPKIEFSLKDCLGRVWQCGTMQVDFAMPERLGAYYIAEDGSKQIPVMLHRAILGSLERFIGILTEETVGSFPVWLAPVQAVILNITDQQAEKATLTANILRDRGFRVKEDLRNEKIGFKIREHTIQRVPYLLVIGDREVENQTVSVRTREGQDLGSMGLDQFVELLNRDILQRGRSQPLVQEKKHVTV